MKRECEALRLDLPEPDFMTVYFDSKIHGEPMELTASSRVTGERLEVKFDNFFQLYRIKLRKIKLSFQVQSQLQEGRTILREKGINKKNSRKIYCIILDALRQFRLILQIYSKKARNNYWIINFFLNLTFPKKSGLIFCAQNLINPPGASRISLI